MAFDDGDNLDDLELDFVPAEVKREFNLLPAGWTAFDIEEIKPTWNDPQDVMTLVIKLRVPEGEENSRKVLFARHVAKVSVSGEDEVAFEKAHKRLKFGREALGELARAAGVSGSNLAPAIGQRVMANVKVAPENNGYPAKNEVTAYKPIVVAAPPARSQPAAARPAASKPAASPPSFMKKPPKPAPEPEIEAGDESADDAC